MPPARFGHGFRNDIFLSYAHVDNAPDTDRREWVSRFALDLKNRLEMVSGHSVAVWRDDRLEASDQLDPTIAAELSNSAALVTILSPAYFGSDPCRQEREHFIDVFDGAVIRGTTKSRIVKVVKTRVSPNRYPDELRGMLEHRFYKEEPNGTFKEFHLHEREEVRNQYATVLDDVAQELSQLLSVVEGHPMGPPRGAVFLAAATGDVYSERNDLRRFLESDGYAVLPSRNLPVEAEELKQDVKSALQASALAVFVLGCRYGWVPEMGDGKSFVRLQLEHAGSFAPHLPRIIWIPPGVTGSEQPQKEMLDEIRREFPRHGFEVIESNLTTLQTHLRDRLRPTKPPSISPARDRGTFSLYLMVDRCDRDRARPLRQQLLAAGFEVDWLPETGEAGPIRQLHREWLIHDDAFLIYYGMSDATWLAYQKLELRKALGHGRRTPPETRIVLAAPLSPDKEDLRASPRLVLDGLPPKELNEAVNRFVTDLSSARAGRATPPSAQV